ncbi:MAG: InlB B-repeat-containing protein [Treponema sp.]
MYEKRKGSIRLYIAVLLTGLCIFSCTQGHTPDDRIPVPVNDTGINVEIFFDPNGGFWDKPGQTAVKKIIGNTGSPLVFTATPQRNDGMVFSGWNTEGGTVSAFFPARKAVYKAHWRKLKQNEAFYTVEHHQENLDNNDYTVKETEKQYGIIGTALQVSPKSYKGFNYHKDASTVPEKIAADGSAKAILKYVRKQVTLTFNLDGGTTTTPLTGGNSLTGKCGALLTVAEPSQSGKVFNGWNTVGGTLPATFPLNDTEYTAQWEKENLVQNADFSQTESASGPFAGYWINSTSPKEWKTWVNGTQSSTEAITFAVTGGVFTMVSGNNPLTKGGLQQQISLENGQNYTLKVTVKLVNTGAGEHKGGCEIKLCGKSEKLYGGTKTYTIPITGNTSAKLELLASGLQNKSVSFSNISLTKE